VPAFVGDGIVALCFEILPMVAMAQLWWPSIRREVRCTFAKPASWQDSPAQAQMIGASVSVATTMVGLCFH
jgi:hypothetical protein